MENWKSLLELSSRIERLAQQITRLANLQREQTAVVTRLKKQLSAHENEEVSLLASIETYEKAQVVLLALEESWRKDFEKSVESIVSEGIQLVFGDDLYFSVVTSVKAGASAVSFELEMQDGIVSDILDAEGRSIAEVVSFLLRVLLILAFRPALRKVIILDEPFGGISSKNMSAFQQLLRKIVDESGIQIIMTTHDMTHLEYADIVYEVKKPAKGPATVERLHAK